MIHSISILANGGDDGMVDVIAIIIGLVIMGIKALSSVSKVRKPGGFTSPPMGDAPRIAPPLPPPLGTPMQKTMQRRITPGRPSQGKTFTSKAAAYSKLPSAPGKSSNRTAGRKTMSYPAKLPPPLPGAAKSQQQRAKAAFAAPPSGRKSSLPPQAEELSPVTQPPRPRAGAATDGHKPSANQVAVDAATLRRTLRPANLRALIALNEILLPPLALREEDGAYHTTCPGE